MRRARTRIRSSSWTPRLDNFGRYTSYMDSLALIWRNVGAAGALNQEDLLLPYQSRLFGDLVDGVDEAALSDLYNWWDYDVGGLFERSKRWSPDLPAKPRIDLELNLTSKGNFRCEWRPTGLNFAGHLTTDDAPDWRLWLRQQNRSGSWGSRPSNELIFVHDVQMALFTVRHPGTDNRPVALFNHVLLQGLAELIEMLKERLARHFEVTMVTDLFLIWDPVEFDFSSDEPERLVSWEIENPARRQETEELAELASIEEKLGFTEERFEEVWIACEQARRRGRPPLPTSVPTNVAKALRESGLEKVTSRDTDRVRYLIDKYRSKLQPAGHAAEVIAFRPKSAGRTSRLNFIGKGRALQK